MHINLVNPCGKILTHFKIRTRACCIRRTCENIFGAVEIVGAEEGKENEERLEKSSVKAKMTYEDYDWFGMLGL